MNIPDTLHWAIITETSVTIPGDERSRTNPGHGYPEHTETYLNYTVFTDKTVWEKEIIKRMESRWGSPFKAIEARPATISTNIEVKIGC